MNVIQSRKAQNEKQFPGCLGRMVSLFDLGNGVTGNRLLTDKPHNDGSSLPRSRSDVISMLNARFGDQFGDKMIESELRRSSSNKKANGTPMKTLIAQEMSKEVDSRHNPPNVVAKLMGLETIPHQRPNSVAERSHSKGYSRCSLSQPDILVECWEQDHCILEKRMQCEGRHIEQQNEYRDVCEIWKQSEKTNIRDSSPQKGRNNENTNEKKMDLVRQKFIEAKRLATDEKSRQSKEFQDALEVLSSNRDLFLKFMQEPNYMFSQHLYDMQSIPPPETKRITVLRPSKALDSENIAGLGKQGDKQSKRPSQIGQVTSWDKKTCGYSPFSNQRFEEYKAQPTRIVVLKPSPGRPHDMKTVVTPPPSSSPRILQGKEFYDEPEEEEAQELREMAKEITEQIHETMMDHRRDETLLSPVFSNGYIGDDSSFNKSDNEYAVGNLSDLEIMSPTSRHSWDYINRSGSPFSSSFSRASCSPESSVCREAKKRLSERWAMMASNCSSQEQKNARRSTSTLGEMLALSETKKLMVRSEEERINKEQEPRGSTSCTTSNLNKEEGVIDSPNRLLRSKSLPVSCTVYGTALNLEVSESRPGRTEVSKELKKSKSGKSSLKGKVSSLFFSRNKKSNKKYSPSQSKDESQPAIPERPGSPIPLHAMVGDGASHQSADNSCLEDFFSPGFYRPSCNTSPNLIDVAPKQGFVSEEGILSMAKPVMLMNMNENQDQPSPISVLEPPFEEDDNTILEPCGNIRPNFREVPLKSNLIDKSPPIGSIARTLSWDYSFAETATSNSLKPSSCPEEEEQDWPLLIKTLLSEAGLEVTVQLDSLSSQWHSPECPLDPTLRSKYANQNDKDILHEAKRIQRRSNWKLVFDCLNTALMEISGYGRDRSTRGMPLIQGTSEMLLDHVWGQMKEWFCSEVKCGYEETGDSSSLVVESVVRKEVVGKGWNHNLRVELDIMGKEIENKLLAELVEDAVVDLTRSA